MNKSAFVMYGSLLATISFIILIIFPMSPFMLDLAIVISMAIAVLVYMKATSVNSWYEFKTFPSLLLFIFVFRISLNVATTRKILTDGDPGQVIEEFGSFVIGSNLFVGFVVFIILVVFQFIIANGASRTAEVTARFALDGLPGKQMTIDTEVSQKNISPEEGQRRRKMLRMETDFYGAMDGAGKFIKGDVIFGIAAVVVNLLFGLIIGVAVQGMDIGAAANKYLMLTIGDGISNQIASLLIALATGIMLVSVSDEEEEIPLPQGIYFEITKSGIILNALGILLVLVGLFSKLPLVPFVSIGLFMIILGVLSTRRMLQKETKEKEDRLKELENMEQTDNEINKNMNLKKANHPIVVKLGIDLVPLIKNSKEGSREKVEMVRRSLTEELGVQIPLIKVVDNSFLHEEEYAIEIKNAKVAGGNLKSDRVFALKTPLVYKELEAEPGVEPVFLEEGYWIEEDMIETAEVEHYRITDPLNMLIYHLKEVVKDNIHELIQRSQVKKLLDSLEEEHDVLLEEIRDKEVDLSLIQSVIQKLLKEKISIQDLPTIVEAIIDGNTLFKGQVDLVTGLVRERISKYICENMKDEDGKIHVFTLEPNFETEIKVENNYDGFHINLNFNAISDLLGKAEEGLNKSVKLGIEPVLLVGRTDLRFALARLFQSYKLNIPILATNELTQGVIVERLGILERGEE